MTKHGEPAAFHLRWGTAQDNMDDAVDRGRRRYARGERQGSAKLTAADVAEIRRSWNGPQNRYHRTGPTLVELATQFGVSYSAIAGALGRCADRPQTWADA